MDAPPIQFLRAFDAAARHASFKRAAEEIHVTPSAVSQQIKALEDQLGVELFHRFARGVRLTEDGAAFHRVASETLDAYRTVDAIGIEDRALLRDALAGVPVVMVLDRNYSPGTGGILHQELKAVLSGMADGPKVHGLLAGIGGANVSSETIDRWVRDYQNAEPKPESQWVE